jgi:hypothetical protein
VDPLNAIYSSLDGVFFNKDRTALCFYPEGRAGSYTLPDSVTRIEEYAFQDCGSLSTPATPTLASTAVIPAKKTVSTSRQLSNHRSG